MVILLILFIPVILFLIAGKLDYHGFEIISFICGLLGAIASAFAIVALIFCIYVHIPLSVKCARAEYEQRYNSINYVLNNYTGTRNIVSLTEEISDYNSEVITGRMVMDNFWLRTLDYDFYYDLPLIELEVKK